MIAICSPPGVHPSLFITISTSEGPSQGSALELFRLQGPFKALWRFTQKGPQGSQIMLLTLRWIFPPQNLACNYKALTSGLAWICCRELSQHVTCASPSHGLTVREAGCNPSPFSKVAMPPRSTLLLHTGTGIFIATLLHLFSGLDLLL